MKYPVLILNRNFEPFDIWDWQHAISKMLCSNSVEPLYNNDGIVKYDKLIRDGKGNEYELPAILILTEYIKNKNGRAPYTKMNIYARDMGVCQYCGEFVEPKDRTIDHVIPRAHWNPRRFHFKLSSFENVVTACAVCNKRKRNRTPLQAGMTLIGKPRTITRAEAYARKLCMIANKPAQWAPYLKVINVS